ncbi:hypothetical protein ABZW11_03640 [Nonomuraea sp. NPDC004580]
MKWFTDRRIVLLGWSGFVFVPALVKECVQRWATAGRRPYDSAAP